MGDAKDDIETGGRFSTADLSRLGRALGERRRTLGLSMRALATETRVSAAAIRSLEAGQANPGLGTVLAVVDALGADLDQLVEAARAPDGDVAVRRASERDGDGKTTWPLADAALVVDFARVAGDRVAAAPRAAADHPIIAKVVEGSAFLTIAGRKRHRIVAGDVVHAQPGAIEGIASCGAGSATFLMVADTRRGGAASGGRPVSRTGKRMPGGK